MFVLTLPLIFEYTNLLSPFALSFIGIATLLGLYIIAPLPEPVIETEFDQYPVDEAQNYQQQEYPFLYQAWYGSLPLWQVFWPFFIFVNIALYVSDRMVRETFLSVPTWDNILLVCVVIAIWWCVAVWRMSAYCQHRIYSATARLMTLALFSDFILRVFIRIKYPRIFFDCNSMLFDYSSCF